MKTLKISVLALTLGLMSFTTISVPFPKSVKTIVLSAITWKSESIDVGEITQSKPKEIVFEFKNTGKTDILITEVHASCGCTGTNYPKELIAAGKSAKITAVFNAANKGMFTKTVTVTTNVDETSKVLTFKGNVI
jgi:hypothetical protein